MREIGEQWIENGRMYKAVEGPKIVNGLMEGNTCHGCCYVDKWDDDCLNPNQACPVGKGVIIKDLGPVNEEGLLGCPFCGAFPIVRCIEEQEGECVVAQAFCPKGDLGVQEPEGNGHVLWFMRTTLQQVIDAWNRRN